MHHASVGEWETPSGKIVLSCDFDAGTITWIAEGCKPRQLDWSPWGFNNTFTLVGGDENRIVRWRPSVRHPLFDDDHVVWVPYSTKHVVLVDRDIITYTRVKRSLVYFKDVDPHRWCCL